MKRTILSILVLFSLTGCNLAIATPVIYGSNNISSPPTENPQVLVDTAVAQTMDVQTQMAGAVQHTLAAMVTDTPPFPSDTPLPTLTFTPQVPMVSVSVETNCRTGPGTVYPALGILRVGQSAEVVGVSIYKDTWIIKLPSNPAVTCWLWGQYATVVGDTNGLPALNPPPTPTPSVNFNFTYNIMGVGPGYECLLFTATNVSGATWESYSFTVKDTTLNVTGTNTSNDLTGYDAWCLSTGSVGSIGPFTSGAVNVTIIVLTDPTGDHYDATLTLCTGNNQTGTCLTKTKSSQF
jgi:hypothetical protein